MASLGEAEFTVNSWIAGRMRVLNIYADSALYPRLGLSLGVVLDDLSRRESRGQPGPTYEWRDVTGELRLAEHSHAIGLLSSLDSRRPLRPASYSHEHQIKLVCELDPWRLEVLERHRNGGPPQLWVEFWPVLTAGTEHIDVSTRAFRLDIPRELWLEFLGRVGGSQFDVLEVQYTNREAERFHRAVARTREARVQIANGEYDVAVAECRKVIEALGHELKEGQEEPLRTLFEQRTDARRAKEYLGIISKLKQLAGFAHHDFGAPIMYTRAEAQFILRTTEGLLSLVGALTTVS